MWKCISHLKKRDENQDVWSTSLESDVEVVLPHGDQPPMQVNSWLSSEIMGPPQVYPEAPPPTYSNLVLNKKSSLKMNIHDIKHKVFVITT
ncbi:hypothetical protein L798_03027 [Zootermopsis nevadensis]|uniref:Uncharacterized protein n=1 Tax=Zootermopsis nevadensis TaxID=136037 RepID=A0A067RQI2_ZOONE|nr:hypothetical protein L798_03027 [Zootermopsis nevadensis]